MLTQRESLVGRAYACFASARFAGEKKEDHIQQGLKLLMLASWPETKRRNA